eukprot:COSAG06_NODE_2866_length_6157_cov_2.940574_5_plen_67_part_01
MLSLFVRSAPFHVLPGAVTSGADRHLPLLESIGRKKGASSAHPCILTLELHEVLPPLHPLDHDARIA